MTSLKPKVAILGGGIHGVATAYYLSLRGYQPVIIERTSIAAAASGKAGGFLAREWGRGPTVQLHQKSFDLHIELAQTLHITSFLRVQTLSVSPRNSGANVATWLDRKSTSTIMDSNTAQVTPKELVDKMLNAAIEMGTSVIIGTIESVCIENDKIIGVNVTEMGFVDCERLLVCLGPWSGVFCQDYLNVDMPVMGLSATAAIIKDEKITTEPYACFCESDSNGVSLEMYSRSGGELYVCGFGDQDRVYEDRLRSAGDCFLPDMVKPNIDKASRGLSSLKVMTSIGDNAPEVIQACMLPCAIDGLPVMGKLEKIDGVYTSFGHSCWGILWGPISGLAMAELIDEGTCQTINLAPFSPNRFK